ncbi:hypothetical protein [Symbioplanes lichenis]|uniref:hypothetical protein n=1 Tax=Symbioplanes lichenis TaxID=1629072 RepID=UPI00273847F0|nr:hypothetical protein [Actinoplanes lichenis]
MDEPIHTPAATQAALAALAQGTCEYPGCRTPVTVFVGDRYEVNVEYARIRGTDPAGPRHDPALPAADRDAFDNLLLLCSPHRRLVDRDEQAYPAGLLEIWASRPPGNNLRGLTERRLDSLLTTAFATARDHVDEALARLEKTDPEAADLLRHLMDDQRTERYRYGTDPRLAATLARISDQLDLLTRQPPPEPRPPRPNIGWRS